MWIFLKVIGPLLITSFWCDLFSPVICLGPLSIAWQVIAVRPRFLSSMILVNLVASTSIEMVNSH